MTVEEEFNPSSVFGHMDIHGAGPRTLYDQDFRKRPDVP